MPFGAPARLSGARNAQVRREKSGRDVDVMSRCGKRHGRSRSQPRPVPRSNALFQRNNSDRNSSRTYALAVTAYRKDIVKGYYHGCLIVERSMEKVRHSTGIQAGCHDQMTKPSDLLARRMFHLQVPSFRAFVTDATLYCSMLS